jgi:DNA-binding response OmpR family regulator
MKLRHLRSKYPLNTKLIIFTGYDFPKRLQSFALGADDYMKKPIFPSELEARIRRLLRPAVATDVAEPLALPVGLLSPMEEKLLRLLLSTHRAPLGHATLTEQLGITQSSLYTCLSRLKAKVAGVYEIKTAYGRGWWGEGPIFCAWRTRGRPRGNGNYCSCKHSFHRNTIPFFEIAFLTIF